MRKSFINKYCRKLGFELHGTSYMQSILKGSYKDEPFEMQKNILSGKASIIFDIGANRGDVTLKYLSLFPKAEIYAFEPFPETFKILELKKTDNLNIHTFQKALSERNGSMPFYVNKNVDTNSLLKPQKMGLSSDKQVQNLSIVEVETITIDSFCNDKSITKIDILKLDIQGGELGALKGAERLLSSGKIGLIYTETYFQEQYEKQPLFYEIAAFLKQHNYFLQDLYNPIYGKGSIAWCDAIFLPVA